MSKIAVVICSRLASSRLPNKAHLKIENKTIIAHLVTQLLQTDIPIIISVPHRDYLDYVNDESLPKIPQVIIHQSEFDDDPLARMAQVQKQFGIETIVRVTHDKIFIDTECLKAAILCFKNEKAEYLYCSNLIPGTNFELISARAIQEATAKFKKVEFISYAVRVVSKKTVNYTHNQTSGHFSGLNLLIDYEEDFKFFQVILSRIKKNGTLVDVLEYLLKNPEVKEINKKPKLTIYTCAYNSDLYIDACIDSVIDQFGFDDFEFVMIDDCSKDATFETMAKRSLGLPNVRYYRNEKNFGLATSSNIALSKARGEYIVRMDSDDYFTYPDACFDLLKAIQTSSDEIIYPNNYFGNWETIQKGNEKHHVGGAIFNKSALNFIKFTDGLRGYEGYDLFLRANNRLKIGYFQKPVFFYTQRPDSMSKTNLKERRNLEIELQRKHLGEV